MGGPGEVVPIVPGAVIFDLGRGGDFASRPDAAFGAEAYRAALSAAGAGAVPQGVVGAGTGASAGQLKGGIGSASAVLADGTTVAALLVVNPVGSTVDPETGELYAARFGLDGEFPALATPSEDDVRAARAWRSRCRARRSARPAGAGHDDRRHRHRRHADQGAVRQGRRHRP